MTIGIYKIENNINNHIYIGLSKDIENRVKTHFNVCYNSNSKEYNKVLYRAIRKYGKENFDILILEECTLDNLYDREKYYIEKYNSFKNGYNETRGGDGVSCNIEENHPNHKLLKEDVIDIRNRYNNKERSMEVFSLYKNKISRSGFDKVWKGETWKCVRAEVFTDENKLFHKKNTGSPGSKNPKSKLREEDVIKIRKRRISGDDKHVVYCDYEKLLTFRSFEQVWYNQNWKNVVINPVSTISVVGE